MSSNLPPVVPVFPGIQFNSGFYTPNNEPLTYEQMTTAFVEYPVAQGDISFQSATFAGDVSISGPLSVGQGVTASGITASGTVTASGITASGTVSASGLTINGTSTFRNNVDVSGGLDVSGGISVYTGGVLVTGGTTNVQGLSVQGAAAFNSTSAFDKKVNVTSGGLDVSGGLNASGTTNLYGAVNASNLLTCNNGLTVTSGAIIPSATWGMRETYAVLNVYVNTTLSNSVQIVFVESSNVTITLPPANQMPSRCIYIKNGSTTTLTTIVGNIDGSINMTLQGPNECVHLYCNSFQWYILSLYGVVV
jgi:hypothetical protein